MAKQKSSIFALLFAITAPVVSLAVLIFPTSRAVFLSVTEAHPYIMGFVKFALLATAGEIIAAKISTGAFSFPVKAVLKAIVWGVIGMMIALIFPVFSAGVAAAQDAGLLFAKDNFVITAIIISIINNLTFGLAMMAFHRIIDTMIELSAHGQPAKVLDAVKAVDWTNFVGFVVFRTIPLFWIPAHSITFMLPSKYRIFMSAFLSIILGLLLAIAKRRSSKKMEVSA